MVSIARKRSATKLSTGVNDEMISTPITTARSASRTAGSGLVNGFSDFFKKLEVEVRFGHGRCLVILLTRLSFAQASVSKIGNGTRGTNGTDRKRVSFLLSTADEVPESTRPGLRLSDMVLTFYTLPEVVFTERVVARN